MKKPKIRVNRHTVSALCILGILGIIITLITLYNVLHPLIQQTMPSISVFPTYINTCSEIIVSWKNMIPNEGFLALYSPPESEDEYPFWKKNVKHLKRYKLPDGGEYVSLQILNMRKNYQIRYLCGNVVFSGPIVKVNANFPMQGHLALTGDSSEMRYQ